MLRRILKWAGIAIVALAATGAVLYVLGLRVVLYGGGSPRLRFVKSEGERVARIARDREAQRAQTAATQPRRPPRPRGRAAAAPVLTAALGRRPGGRRACRRGLLDGLPRPEPRRPLPGQILTQWPADGLKPIWKQPVGGGYASFVIAGGRAFTIEQRGPQEIVAAYDVATGREL